MTKVERDREWRCYVKTQYYVVENMIRIIDFMRNEYEAKGPDQEYLKVALVEWTTEFYNTLIELYSLLTGDLEADGNLDEMVKSGMRRQEILAHIRSMVNELEENT